MRNIQDWWNRKWTGLAVVVLLLFFLSFFIYALTNQHLVIGYNKGYEPTQPIPFSHEVHAGQYRMDCRYCHTSVEEGRFASVPSLNICMNCHLNIRVDRPWIQKLRQAYDNNEPVQWEKVHLLPDFVRFHHAPHIKALNSKNSYVEGSPLQIPDTSIFKQSCYTCHGEVEQMPVLYQYESLSMGWCIECHRQEENKPWLLQCSTCHY